MTALGLALSHPRRILSIAVSDARAEIPEEHVKLWEERVSIARKKGLMALAQETLQRWFTQEAHTLGIPEVEKAREMIKGTSIEGYAGAVAAISKLAFLPRLREITCPVLFLVGDQDPGTPPAAVKLMHEAVPGSKYVLIERASHLSNMEQPDVFNAALRIFLSETEFL
jgi:3-oxoadipate enol-lactonase